MNKPKLASTSLDFSVVRQYRRSFYCKPHVTFKHDLDQVIQLTGISSPLFACKYSKRKTLMFQSLVYMRSFI